MLKSGTANCDIVSCVLCLLVDFQLCCLSSCLTGSRWAQRFKGQQRREGNKDRETAQSFLKYSIQFICSRSICGFMLSVKLSGHSFVFLSPLLCCACRERMVFQGPRGRWEQRGMLGTMELKGLEAKMDLKVLKASWVPRGRLDLLVFLERRYSQNHS